jgi:hypothetical protein
LFANGNVVALWESSPTQTVIISSSIKIDTTVVGKDNSIYALARDESSNTAMTIPMILTVKRTLIQRNNLKQISILDRSGFVNINLDTVFVDTLTHTTLLYQIIANTNAQTINAQINGNILHLVPTPYLSGNSSITIKASTGTRTIQQTFNVMMSHVPLKFPGEA